MLQNARVTAFTTSAYISMKYRKLQSIKKIENYLVPKNSSFKANHPVVKKSKNKKIFDLS